MTHGSYTNFSAIASPRNGKRTSSQSVPPGPPGIDNGAHGTEKLLLNTQITEDFEYNELILKVRAFDGYHFKRNKSMGWYGNLDSSMVKSVRLESGDPWFKSRSRFKFFSRESNL